MIRIPFALPLPFLFLSPRSVSTGDGFKMITRVPAQGIAVLGACPVPSKKKKKINSWKKREKRCL